MRKTKIVCTIGPASETVETLVGLIEAGMNVARLNFSHGNFEEHGQRIKNIREASEKTGKTVAILLDTKGPEIRTGAFKNGEAYIERDQDVTISMKEVEGTASLFSVTYEGLFDDVEVGAKILIDDGLIELQVTSLEEESRLIHTRALNSGEISNNKGVNVPNVHVSLPGMTEKDAGDIIFGVEQGVDFIAASFIRRQSDVLEIRNLLEEHGAADMHIISKIENQEGVDKIDSILDVCDGIMVARGDLGVEIPAEDVPLVQKDLITKCNAAGKPVITATQMLDSMQRNPRPTRAEASDVANAIFDGTDAIMLSGETAAGDYPVEAVQTMNNIARKAETRIDHKAWLRFLSKKSTMSVTDGISQSVSHTAMNLGVTGIITSTESGHTARMISKYRPQVPVVAVTISNRINRQLALVWGVHAVKGPKVDTIDQMLEVAVDRGLSTKLIERGSKVIITAGVPIGESGTTNFMKVHIIGDVIAKGTGIGKTTAYGKAIVAKNAKEAIDNMIDGGILVTIGTDWDMMPAINRASALVTEEGGLTSHAAVVGLSLGIPVIVGVEGAINKIKNHEDITIDGAKGDVYEGHASVL